MASSNTIVSVSWDLIHSSIKSSRLLFRGAELPEQKARSETFCLKPEMLPQWVSGNCEESTFRGPSRICLCDSECTEKRVIWNEEGLSVSLKSSFLRGPLLHYVKVAPYARDRNTASPPQQLWLCCVYSSLRICLLPTVAVLGTL